MGIILSRNCFLHNICAGQVHNNSKSKQSSMCLLYEKKWKKNLCQEFLTTRSVYAWNCLYLAGNQTGNLALREKGLVGGKKKK